MVGSVKGSDIDFAFSWVKTHDPALYIDQTTSTFLDHFLIEDVASFIALFLSFY